MLGPLGRWADLNSMSTKGLSQDFLSVKGTRTDGETVSTPDSVNLIKQHSLTLDELPKRKTAKILNLQLQQMKPINETKTLLVSAIIIKIQNTGKEIVTNLSTLVLSSF